MLRHLRVTNFAILSDVSLELTNGFNVLTGETGAGKSLIVEAVNLLRGGRASADIPRAGAQEAVVEALFEVPEDLSDLVDSLLDDAGLPASDEDLLVRRVIHKGGRSRTYINGAMTTAGRLAQLGAVLVELAGQHQHQGLVDPKRHRAILDGFGGHDQLVGDMESAFGTLREADEALRSLRDDATTRQDRLDYLRFQLVELDEAKLVAGEDEELEQERARLQATDQLSSGTRRAEALVYADDDSAVDRLAQALRSLEFIQRYAQQGGVVIALERVPTSSVGLRDYATRDRKVKAIVGEMFAEPRGMDDTGPRDYGNGRTYFLKQVLDRRNVLDRRSSALDPFVNTLRAHVRPDLGIDFAHEGLRENQGLTFIHRRAGNTDLYFLTNVQDRPSGIPITFRVRDKTPWHWNPYNGTVSRIMQYKHTDGGTRVPLRLAPYESAFILFEGAENVGHVVDSDFDRIVSLSEDRLEARTSRNGTHAATIERVGRTVTRSITLDDVPPALGIGGPWQLTLAGRDFPKLERTITRLTSWTRDPRSRHFSGTGRYAIRFDLPERYTATDLELHLDLGRVGNVAEVRLNDTPVGTCWMRGQTLNVTGQVRAGSNQLVVLVTNTLINRVSAMTEPRPIPEHLVEHYGSATRAFARGAHSPIGFKPLPASGLLGPVRIVPSKKVVMNIE